MGTEEASFWSRLQQYPDDTLTKLVFADWLQDRGDVRSEAVRVLVANEYRPTQYEGWYWGTDSNNLYGKGTIGYPDGRNDLLPDDWFRLLPLGTFRFSPMWKHYPTRLEAVQVAVEAFTQLPEWRRTELLQVAPV